MEPCRFHKLVKFTAVPSDPDRQVPKKTRRGRPPTLSSDDRAARILTAAMGAFVTQGFARTTMTDIARRAGMSKRDLYMLFQDKDALFAAAIQSRRHLLLDLPRPPDEVRAPLDALRLIFRLDLDDRQAEERDALMNLIARESLIFPELNAMLYDTGVIRSRELLMEWLAGQMQRGALPDCDMARLAGMLMDIVFGALLPRRRRKGPVDRGQIADEIVARIAIVLHGIEGVDGQPTR